MAFIITTISTQIIPLQHKPRGQPSTQSLTAEATHCRLSTESLLHSVSGQAEDDLQLCIAELPPRNAAVTHTARLSSRKAANNSFASACNTPNCLYCRKKNSKNKLLPTSYIYIILLSRGQHRPLSSSLKMLRQKSLFSPLNSTLG